MSTIVYYLPNQIPSCIGAANLGGGLYRVDFIGSSRAATTQEIAAAQAAVDADNAQTALNKAARQELRNNFQQWKDKLQAVRDEVDFTNAKRDAALKDLAQVQIKILSVVKTLALD